MGSARVFGGGIGAMCCAALLRRKGWNVTMCLPPKTHAPSVVLNAVTVQIIHDIFGDVTHVFRDAQPINRHYVNWGGNLPVEFTPSAGLTLDGGVLSARLLDLLRQDARIVIRHGTPAEPAEGSFDWNVYAMNNRQSDKDNSSIVPASRFGQRYAISSEVTLSNNSDGATSLIESTRRGWLFLAPLAAGRAVLQGVVPEQPKEVLQTLCDLLDHTKEIKRIVGDVGGRTYAVECAPMKLRKMDGAHWLATGTAACSYDPLSGDGSGYAMRAAILAAAVLEGIERGTARESLLNYYKLRLTYAFYTHIRSCLSLYLAAELDDSWRAELSMMETGVREVAEELTSISPYQYSLEGFELSVGA